MLNYDATSFLGSFLSCSVGNGKVSDDEIMTSIYPISVRTLH